MKHKFHLRPYTSQHMKHKFHLRPYLSQHMKHEFHLRPYTSQYVQLEASAVYLASDVMFGAVYVGKC